MKELDRLEENNGLLSYLPAILVIVGAFAMLGVRIQVGASFISDTALMMIALACYILAALFQLTNLYAPSSMAEKIGLYGASLGVFFNLSSWLIRWASPSTPASFRMMSCIVLIVVPIVMGLWLLRGGVA